MKQQSLFTIPQFLRVEIIKTLGEVFNGKPIAIPCPICHGQGWAFVNPLPDLVTGECHWGWICERCQAQTGWWDEPSIGTEI